VPFPASSAARTAAQALVDALPDETAVAVVAFDDESRVIAAFTTDRGEVSSAIASLALGGETALYQAVVTAAALFDPRSDASRNIILLSDGGNTVDESSLGLAQSAVQASGAVLYAVSLQTSESNTDELEIMVADSGGSVTAVSDTSGLSSLYAGFAETLASQYRLEFEGAGTGPVETYIAAQSGNDVVAETRFQVQMPPPAEALPTATPVAAGDDEEAVADRVVASPTAFVVESPGRDWLKPVAIILLTLAIALGAYLVLFPTRRRNPLRDMTPVVARAGVGTARGIQRIPGLLTGAADRVLARRGMGARLATWLEAAGLEIRNSEFAVLVVLAGVISFFLGGLRSIGFGIALSITVVLAIFLLVSVLVSRRRAAFAAQLNGTLQLMASSLRTGYSLPQSFDVVASEIEAPTGEEFTRVVVEGRLGRDLVDSCNDVAERMNNEDFRWVTGAIDVTRSVGGDLAEVLDNVAATIRARERVRRQIKSLSAEGRISAVILTILPFPMFFWQLLVNREYTLLLFTTSLGQVIFWSGVVSLVIGILWMRKIVQLKY